ncbi:MAG: hypothetical protein VCD50_11515 [Alphaproteobacteria bacterium]|jgi:hypothetical protein
MTRSIAVVVLGAGRSGTSAATRGLAAVGVDLGDRLRAGWGKNPTGFFEDRDILALNQRLKRILGVRGDSVRLIEPEEWDRPEVVAHRAEAVDTLKRRFGGSPLWGYKYGRTLRFLPFWEAVHEALDLDVRYLLALRNPLSVAASRGKLDSRRGRQQKSDLEWLVNIVPYFRRARTRPLVAVDFDSLLAAPEVQLARITEQLALPPADPAEIAAYAQAFLRPGMRHSRFTADDLEGAADPLVYDAYRWLHGLASDALTRDDETLWQDWARIEGALDAMRGALNQLDHVEDELRAAKRHPLGALQSIPPLWRRITRG